MSIGHLARRFIGSLSPARPSTDDVGWVSTVLEAGEFEEFKQMRREDQRHSIAVARDVVARLAGSPYESDSVWPATALLHDVGKVDCALGPFGRVLATCIGFACGRARVCAWSTRRGIARRLALYLRHDELGADRLRMVGARGPVVEWAGAHHHRAVWESTGIPEVVIAALDAADND